MNIFQKFWGNNGTNYSPAGAFMYSRHANTQVQICILPFLFITWCFCASSTPLWKCRAYHQHLTNPLKSKIQLLNADTQKWVVWSNVIQPSANTSRLCYVAPAVFCSHKHFLEYKPQLIKHYNDWFLLDICCIFLILQTTDCGEMML